MPEETGWLIQADESFRDGRIWLCLQPCWDSGVERRQIGWTEDSESATRFARRIDARNFALLHPKHCTLACLIEYHFTK